MNEKLNITTLTIQENNVTEMNEVISKIKLLEIGESPYQGRMIFIEEGNEVSEEENIEMLAENIRENGLLNPVIVRKTEDQYQLIDGHRRVEAVRLLGHNTISSIVKNMTEREAQVMTVVGNLQRKDLFNIEKALAFRKILEAGIFIDKRELSKAIGKDETYVGDLLNTLKLDKRIIDDLLKNKSTNDVRLLRAIRRIEETNDTGHSKKQWELYRRFLYEGLTRQDVLNISRERDSEKEKAFTMIFKPRRIEISLNKIYSIKKRKELIAILDKKLTEIFEEFDKSSKREPVRKIQ